jgi:hypothetical protein
MPRGAVVARHHDVAATAQVKIGLFFAAPPSLTPCRTFRGLRGGRRDRVEKLQKRLSEAAGEHFARVLAKALQGL